MTAPIGLGLLLASFWKRWLGWGLVMVNAMVRGKVLWSMANDGDISLTVLAAQLSGLAVCDVVVVLVARRLGLPISLRGGARSEKQRKAKAGGARWLKYRKGLSRERCLT
jgi:hypothetical protein